MPSLFAHDSDNFFSYTFKNGSHMKVITVMFISNKINALESRQQRGAPKNAGRTQGTSINGRQTKLAWNAKNAIIQYTVEQVWMDWICYYWNPKNKCFINIE